MLADLIFLILKLMMMPHITLHSSDRLLCLKQLMTNAFKLHRIKYETSKMQSGKKQTMKCFKVQALRSEHLKKKIIYMETLFPYGKVALLFF